MRNVFHSKEITFSAMRLELAQRILLKWKNCFQGKIKLLNNS